MKLLKDEKAEGELGLLAIAGIVVILLVLAAALFVGWPQYKIYKMELNGKAELAEAEWSKQIAIEEAKADLESAKLRAESTIIEAQATAEANEIVAGSLDPMYINYLIAKGLTDGSSEVIYIPTEASIPIIDAGRVTGNAVVAATASN